MLIFATKVYQIFQTLKPLFFNASSAPILLHHIWCTRLSLSQNRKNGANFPVSGAKKIYSKWQILRVHIDLLEAVRRGILIFERIHADADAADLCI